MLLNMNFLLKKFSIVSLIHIFPLPLDHFVTGEIEVTNFLPHPNPNFNRQSQAYQIYIFSLLIRL